MRVALQAAMANEAKLSERETEIADLKVQVSKHAEVESRAQALEAKIISLESEIAQVRSLSILTPFCLNR